MGATCLKLVVVGVEMKFDLASPEERNLEKLDGACKLAEPPIKPLASAARAFDGEDDADNRDQAYGSTAINPADFNSQANRASLLRLIVSLSISLLIMQQCIIGTTGAGFSLDFSPKESRNVQVTSYDPSPMLMQVLVSDCGEEFAGTNNILMQMKEALEEYGRREQLEPISEEMKVHLVSANLVRLGVNLIDEPQVQKTASDLDFVMATFWVEFLLLIQRIVTEKPQELNAGIDLAYRCARYPELMTLQRLASQSGLYSMVWDIFTSELYVHCVRRKLTTLTLTQIKPSSAVRQFVDIYINFPVHSSAILAQTNPGNEERYYASKLLAASGLQFDLQRALATYGPLQAAANLVFDTDTSPLSLGSPDVSLSSQRLVDRFRVECQELMGKLSRVWGDLDEVAGFMSSPMNDLREFSKRIKMATSPLIYGFVCGQLIQTISA